jgi:hypothetical protein
VRANLLVSLFSVLTTGQGTIRGQEGFFPSSFVTVIEDLPPAKRKHEGWPADYQPHAPPAHEVGIIECLLLPFKVFGLRSSDVSDAAGA